MSWNPTPIQRKLAFVGIVIVLAAFGIYITVPGISFDFGGSEPAGSTAPEKRAAASGSAKSRADPPGPEKPPSEQAGGPPLTQLLPLDNADVREAFRAAERFVAAYSSYRYDDPPGAYADRLAPMVTVPLASDLERMSGAPAARGDLERKKVVAEGSAEVDRIRMLAEDTMVLGVTADQEITKAGGTETSTADYAVTLVREGDGWMVSNLADASAGDVGDEP